MKSCTIRKKENGNLVEMTVVLDNIGLVFIITEYFDHEYDPIDGPYDEFIIKEIVFELCDDRKKDIERIRDFFNEL